jgi:hypothetical protein
VLKNSLIPVMLGLQSGLLVGNHRRAILRCGNRPVRAAIDLDRTTLAFRRW